MNLEDKKIAIRPALISDLRKIYSNSISPVLQEFNQELTPSYGEIPSDLKGTLFRNGAGSYSMGKDQYSHPFDGDGMVSSFEFKNKKVFYKNSYVKTKEYIEEKKAGKMLYRAFGTNLPGGIFKNAFNTKFKNAANTNIINHGGNLLALWEGGWPHKIDPLSLDTVERFSFDGKLKNPFGFLDRMANPELPFSAHPKIDPATGNMYNFGTAFGVKNRLLFYKIKPNGEMQSLRYLNISKLSFVHDFFITSQSKAIFFCTPVSFDISSMMMGLKSPAAGMKGNPKEKIKIIVFDLEGPEGEINEKNYQIFEAPYAFVFHYVNAYEKNNIVHIYSVEMPDIPDSDLAKKVLVGEEINYPTTSLIHYELDLNKSLVKKNDLNLKNIELPRVLDSEIGKDFNEFYATSSKHADEFPFMNQIISVTKKGDLLNSFSLESGLTAEPVPVRVGENTYILTVCYNDLLKKNELIILKNKELKIQCRFELPHSQPIGFHGNWVSA